MTDQVQDKAPVWVVERLDSREVYDDDRQLLGYTLFDLQDPARKAMSPLRGTRSSAWSDVHHVRYIAGHGLTYVAPGSDRADEVVLIAATGRPHHPPRMRPHDDVGWGACVHCGADLVSGYDGPEDSQYVHFYVDSDPRHLRTGQPGCALLIPERTVRLALNQLVRAKKAVTHENTGRTVESVRKALEKAGLFDLAKAVVQVQVRSGMIDAAATPDQLRAWFDATIQTVHASYAHEDS